MRGVVSVMTASSRTGAACVAELLARYAANVDVRAVFRTDKAADALRRQETSAEVVVGPDADAPASLEDAFEGASTAVIVTPHRLNATDMPRDAELSNNMVHAAVEAGVEHIVYVGSWTVHHPEAMPTLASRFAPTEALLASLDPRATTFTALRSGYFATNTATWKPTVARMGALTFPDVHLPIVDPRDIGAAAAAIAGGGDPKAHAGKFYEASGPEMLSMADFAGIFTDVLGKDVVSKPSDLEAVCKAVPPYFAEVLRHLAAHGPAAVPMNNDLELLTGRHRTFREWLEDNRAVFE